MNAGGDKRMTCWCVFLATCVLYHGSCRGDTRITSKHADVFLDKLFSKYGKGGHMTMEGFEHLLANLGLGGISIDDHKLADHLGNNNFKVLHSDGHKHGLDNSTKHSIENGSSSSTEHRDPSSGPEKSSLKIRNENKNLSETATARANLDILNHNFTELLSEKEMCLSPFIILSGQKITFDTKIDRDTFLWVCPTIVEQLDSKSCSGRKNSILKKPRTDIRNEHEDGWDIGGIPFRIWGFSSLAVLVISLVGLLGVAVIPIIDKVFYNHLLQFLVALAIGSLSGDAMLHLMPQALGDSHEAGHDSVSVWKGLTGLLGMYLFFVLEKIMKMCTHTRQKKRNKLKGVAIKPSQQDSSNLSKESSKYVSHGTTQELQEFLLEESTVKPDTEKGVQVAVPMDDHCIDGHDTKSDDYVSHESNDSHSHSHHGHGHVVPDSIAAVAWMVILGDGMHNLCDGLAIGASFAASIPVGLSTSVAVFCHELPHELGDFAMLLKAGMKVKQAMFYNIVSSVLSFVGMCIGVLLGNTDGISQWLFMSVAGMFIYISLVDMLPELLNAKPHPRENGLCHFLLQNVGIICGVSIMLIIALFEERIKFE